MNKNYYIGVGLGWGAQIGECQDGAKALLQESFFQGKSTKHIMSRCCIHDKKLDIMERMEEIHYVNKALSDLVFHTYVRGERPCIIGGDHSIAVGTWNGVKRAINEEIGLLWIDAHMDSHTFETTPSNAPHGMSLAGLLGKGNKALSELHFESPVLFPQTLCLFGTRSYEEGEKHLLHRLGVRIIDREEIAHRGIYSCIEEAFSIVGKAKGGFGISLDLDVFDPMEAPGVGSREANGIRKEELLSVLPMLFSDERFLALELVEYNPTLDQADKTKKLAIEVLTMMDLSARGIFQDAASSSVSV